jgi:hypothetical protein
MSNYQKINLDIYYFVGNWILDIGNYLGQLEIRLIRNYFT